MDSLRSLPDGCASAASFAVGDVKAALTSVSGFLSNSGLVERKTFSVTCTVVHPDKLACVCKAKAFMQDGGYVLELTRMRGDSVLFALVLRLFRVYLETGAAQDLFRGQLLPRHRCGPSRDPSIVPYLELPPAI